MLCSVTDHLIIMEDECPLEIESTLSEDSSPITFVDDLDISLVSERYELTLKSFSY